MSWTQHIRLFRKQNRKILAGALIFWLLLGLLVWLTELIAQHYFGARSLDMVEQRQYFLRWFLWLLLTPLIMILALRINIGNTRLAWFIALHICCGTAVLGLEFLGEVLVIKPLAEQVYRRPVLIDELAAPFLLKYFGYIINYFLIVGIVNMYVYMQSLQATREDLLQTELRNGELQYRLTLAELQALKMQIQPHFLFNAHQSVIGLILRQEPDKAVTMLVQLSSLLRTALEQQDRELVPLSEELQTAALYLSIQQLRFGERFSYRIDADPGIAAARVPYFLLQPLVENAVLHGAEQTDAAVEVIVSARLEGEALLISVSNTKPGTPRTRKGMGIGTGNITARLAQYYGDKAFFRLDLEQEHVTLAQMRIPL